MRGTLLRAACPLHTPLTPPGEPPCPVRLLNHPATFPGYDLRYYHYYHGFAVNRPILRIWGLRRWEGKWLSMDTQGLRQNPMSTKPGGRRAFSLTESSLEPILPPWRAKPESARASASASGLRLVRSVTCTGLLATLTPDAVPAHRALSLCQALSKELCVTEPS